MSRSLKKGPYINVSLEGQSFNDLPGFRGTHCSCS